MDYRKEKQGLHIIYCKHMYKMDKKDLTEQQKLCNQVYTSGAFGIWLCLFNDIVREGWKDHAGYPIKKEFFDKGQLACSISMRKLVDFTGLPMRQVKKHIKFLKDIGWIRIANNTAKRNQGIYILGVWEEIKDAKGKVYKKETMFEYMIKEGTLKSPCIEEEPDKIEYCGDLPEAEFKAKMVEVYGESFTSFIS